VNIADYPELYEVIGTAWNYSAGITDTNFQLPDLKGRVTLGYDESSSKTPRINTTQPVTANYGAVGNTGGKQFVQLTSLENGKHSHSTELFSRNGWPNDSADRTNNYYWISKEVDPAGATKGLAIDDSGNGNPHENRQPYAVVYKLIRYK
jgi:microcystin-dependent protein